MPLIIVVTLVFISYLMVVLLPALMSDEKLMFTWWIVALRGGGVKQSNLLNFISSAQMSLSFSSYVYLACLIPQLINTIFNAVKVAFIPQKLQNYTSILICQTCLFEIISRYGPTAITAKNYYQVYLFRDNVIFHSRSISLLIYRFELAPSRKGVSLSFSESCLMYCLEQLRISAASAVSTRRDWIKPVRSA